MKKCFCLLSFLFFLPFAVCYGEKLYTMAPSQLAGTTRQMKAPGFWIGRHSSPDKIFLNRRQIENYNAYIRNELKLTTDITKVSLSAEELETTLENNWNDFRAKKFYLPSGKTAAPAFFQDLKAKMDLSRIPARVDVRFGFIVHYADQRFFPTEEGLYAQEGDFDFDELQNSTLDVGTPVAILHKSRDRLWSYTISAASAGWVRTKDIAVVDLKEVQKFFASKSFVITKKARTDIFLDPQLTKFYDYARMGSRFLVPPLSPSGVTEILLPIRQSDGRAVMQTAYVRGTDVYTDYLPYTARNMIEQAFELLNQPYGWGGMYGEQDCSAFLQEIFAVVGISLPRDSKDQAKVGKVFATFNASISPERKNQALINDGIGGITLLHLKGHILLFLGSVGQRAYAIHATWGYREKDGNEQRVRVINRVIVSDLSLGEGSQKGSLLERLEKISLVSP